MITITAFAWVPPFAQGSVRDLRVRWALEEAGLPYQTRLLGLGEHKQTEHRTRQPFGQVPTFEEDGRTLFESGAIVLYLAERSAALAPAGAAGRAEVMAWAFAALNTLEPHVANLADIDLFSAGEAWAAARRPAVTAAVRERLEPIQQQLNGRDWLTGAAFSAADILMVTVLRDLRKTEILPDFPGLEAYRARAEARPAFIKALADQLAPFARNAPQEGDSAAG